jgi:hypothetical protein
MKKITYLLLAVLLAATAAVAQTAYKALIINLKDGTSAEYELADIKNLSFTKQSKPNLQPTEGPYAVGDYFCDGKIEGVVVTVDATGSYGTIAAMEDMSEKLAWSTDYDVTGATDLLDGLLNMATVAILDANYTNYPAFKACSDMGDGWYLPAQKELQGMRNVLDKVNPTLTKHEYPEISTSAEYWSSSEADQYSDAMAFVASMSVPGIYGLQKQLTYSVRAFHEFGEKPQPNFTVGNLYNKDGMTGIIYWVSDDDTYARIISLTESDATWGTLGTTVGAKSSSDGESNLNAVKAVDATLENYPAFKNCVSLGDGWYLPSANELTKIASLFNDLNDAFYANNATQLSTSYYWSSTEYTSDTANSAISVLLTDGSSMGSSKNIERKVRAIAFVGERPNNNKTYAIGDPYYEGDDVIGIVCEISDGGAHGKIISLNNVTETGRINVMWDIRANSDNYVLLNASSLDDGEVNMSAARANDPELANLNAFRMCASLGDGWYLGAKNEMLNLYQNKSVLDTALKTYGGSALDSKDYWSSTEGSANATERATSVSLKDGSTFDYRKYFYNLVRPMKKF